MPRLELLDGPKVVHGPLLVARTAEHLGVELGAGVEEVGTVVDEVLFEDRAFVLEMDNLRFQFDDSDVELIHGVRVHWALSRVGGRGVELAGGVERGERSLERDEDGGGDRRRALREQQGGNVTL